MSIFNPNNPGVSGNIFGLPYDVEESDLIILPVPWDVTVSYGAGTANGPLAVLNASTQIDYCIPEVHKPWLLKVSSNDISQEIFKKSQVLREIAEPYIKWFENQQLPLDDHLALSLEQVNQGCQEMVNWVGDKVGSLIDQGKIVGCLGGDHSTPLGLINELSKHHDQFGILQIDAHMDLRDAYEEFEFSHASIMYNVLKNSQVSKLVQVGIRDYCEAEQEFAANDKRVITFYDQHLKEAAFDGRSWVSSVNKIVDQLPEQVYISFDIDGLAPSFCPNTGTPVPGGLTFDEATFLIRSVVKSGRQIIGFDLSEVCPGVNEWDANVGSRLLYHLSVCTGISQGKLRFER